MGLWPPQNERRLGGISVAPCNNRPLSHLQSLIIQYEEDRSLSPPLSLSSSSFFRFLYSAIYARCPCQSPSFPVIWKRSGSLRLCNESKINPIISHSLVARSLLSANCSKQSLWKEAVCVKALSSEGQRTVKANCQRGKSMPSRLGLQHTTTAWQ